MSGPRPESDFPTIADLRDGLTRLVDAGIGDLPVQVLVVPDSTLQAIARDAGHTGTKPAMMIELGHEEGRSRLPVTVVSTDRMQRGNEPYAEMQ